MPNPNWSKLILIVLSVLTIFAPQVVIGITNQRKLLDENSSIKCGCSSCTPCVTNPSPPPPPPAVVPPPPPPPPKKPPKPSKDCPPPPMMTPSSPSIFIPGPPGNLYPIDNFYSGCHLNIVRGWPLGVVSGLVGVIMAFW